MFINAILFGVEENTRKFLHSQHVEEDNKTSLHQHKPAALSASPAPTCNYLLFGVSGAIAGFAQSILLSPIELVKINMQLPNSQHRSTYACALGLLKDKRIMRGTGLTIARDVPAIAIYFLSFEFLCNKYSRGGCRDHLSVLDLMMAGGTAGCLSWLFTYPIDVVKTRYQADMGYRSALDCFKRTLSSEGHMGFWRGLTPTLIQVDISFFISHQPPTSSVAFFILSRAFPNSAATFAAVHHINQLLSNESTLQMLQNKSFRHFPPKPQWNRSSFAKTNLQLCCNCFMNFFVLFQ